MINVTSKLPGDWERNQERRGPDEHPWGWEWGGAVVMEQLTSMAAPYVHGSVLEIGCGGGKWTEWLCSVADSVTAIDVHQVAVEETGARAPSANVVLVDGECLPFADHSFDLVFSFDVLQHLPQCLVYQYIHEARRVGKHFIFDGIDIKTKRGALCLKVYAFRKTWRRVYTYGYYHFYTAEMLQTMCEIAGWGRSSVLGWVGDRGARDVLIHAERGGD